MALTRRRLPLRHVDCKWPVAVKAFQERMIHAVMGLILVVLSSAMGIAGATELPAGQDVCVGHHALRLPVSTKVVVSATYLGLRVRDEGEVPWQQIELSLREQAREAQALPSPGNEFSRAVYRAGGANPDEFFSDSRLVGFDMQADQAVIARHTQGAEYSIEAHRIHAGRHLVFEGKHANVSKYPSLRDGVLAAVSRFTPLASEEMPSSDGFCTGNGVFAIRDRHDVGGDASLYATFPEHPGLRFSLSLYGLVERTDKPSFLERVGRGLFELVASGGKVRTLHRRSREYAGQKGKLVAITMPAEDGSDRRAYKYFWHAEGKPLDPFLPEIEAELMTDTDGTSVDADAIEALWEQVMGSLQARGP